MDGWEGGKEEGREKEERKEGGRSEGGKEEGREGGGGKDGWRKKLLEAFEKSVKSETGMGNFKVRKNIYIYIYPSIEKV